MLVGSGSAVTRQPSMASESMSNCRLFRRAAAASIVSGSKTMSSATMPPRLHQSARLATQQPADPKPTRPVGPYRLAPS